jgi:hypothetical protein
MPQLNPDLVELILEQFDPCRTLDIPIKSPDFSWHDEIRKADHLHHFSQVCRISTIWVVPTRRWLYRDIPLSVTSELRRVEVLLDTANNVPSIRRLVQRLTVNINDANHKAIMSLVAMLPRCAVFVPSTTGLLDPVALDAFVRWGVICCVGIDGIPDWSGSKWSNALQHWTNLVELHTKPTRFPIRMAIQPFTEEDQFEQSLPSLRTLSVGRVFASLPPTTSDTLHTLFLDNCWVAVGAHVSNFILHHSSSLRRICIHNCKFADDPDSNFLDDIGLFSRNLGVLHIDTTGHVTDRILDSLPPSVTELAIDFLEGPGLTPSSCMEFLKYRNTQVVTRLTKFSVRVWVLGEEVLRDWRDVHEAASEDGVEFGCTLAHPKIGSSLLDIGAPFPDRPIWGRNVL